MIPGYQAFDLYPNGEDNKGDVEAAKEALTKCGQPNGFATNIAYRAERPKEKATAEAFQQALSRVGIKLTLKPYPQGDYFSQYAGNPPFVVKNNLGSGRQRLGCRLERRLRLPVPDHRLAGHPGDRWLVQHQRPHPRGGQDAGQRAAGARRGRSATRCGARSTSG